MFSKLFITNENVCGKEEKINMHQLWFLRRKKIEYICVHVYSNDVITWPIAMGEEGGQ